jgi:hypothetical protein
MGSLATGLQEAVFRTLAKGKAPPVVATVRETARAAYPHITFGRTSVYDPAVGMESDSDQLFTLHIWSNARSDDETLAIMKRARALLDGSVLTLDDGSLAMVHLEFAEARNDEDLELRHGLLRFHAKSTTAKRPRRPRADAKA